MAQEEVRRKRSEVMWAAVRNLASCGDVTSHTPRPGVATDIDEEERLDTVLKEMFEYDMTRMLLLYRLPDQEVQRTTRPEWGRIVRNTPELPGEHIVKVNKPRAGRRGGGVAGAMTPPATAPSGQQQQQRPGGNHECDASAATASMEALDQSVRARFSAGTVSMFWHRPSPRGVRSGVV